MKQKLILPLFISVLFLVPVTAICQEEAPEQIRDTLTPELAKEKYGLRVGFDLSKAARSFFQDDYQGLEILGDYRIYEDFYIAAELGNEENLTSEENITANAKGSYIKLGANYNAYNNWSGMENLIFVGLRYGFSTFSAELEEFAIYDRDSYFEPDVREVSHEFNNLTTSWIELQLGVKVEILNNLFLGTHVELKRTIGQTSPSSFNNLYIPGFNRTYDYGNIGVGYGYSISYLIPLYKQ